MNDRPDNGSQLERLLSEVEDLEKIRIALLKRVDELRSHLLDAGERTASMRATGELLCDHVEEFGRTEPDIQELENELEDIEQALSDAGGESASLAFESESLQAMLKETDDDLERLSSMLLERKVKRSRGH